MARPDAGGTTGDTTREPSGQPVTWTRVRAWYRSTPRARVIVLVTAAVFITGWAWNMTGLL